MVLALCAFAAMVFAVGAGSPVNAQRYPPFDIGGSNNTGGSNNNPANNSGSNSEFFNPGAGGSGGGSGSGSGSGGSNTSDDGPFCDLAHCLRFAGEVGGGFVAGRVEELGDLRVAAIAGCCEANSRIDVYIESVRTFLGTVFASEDGSYFGQFTLPASIEPGSHNIVADIEGCGEFRGALQVLARGSGAADGTGVLGTAGRNSTTGGGGVLPRTGGDLFRLMMWALILLGVGTLLVVTTRRLGERLSPVRSFGRRPRARRSIAALPPPEVPFVDTSRFVPYRSATERRVRARSSTRARARTTGSGWARAPKSESTT